MERILLREARHPAGLAVGVGRYLGECRASYGNRAADDLLRAEAVAAACKRAIRLRHAVRDVHTADQLHEAYRAELDALASDAGTKLLARLAVAEAVCDRAVAWSECALAYKHMTTADAVQLIIDSAKALDKAVAAWRAAKEGGAR